MQKHFYPKLPDCFSEKAGLEGGEASANIARRHGGVPQAGVSFTSGQAVLLIWRLRSSQNGILTRNTEGPKTRRSAGWSPMRRKRRRTRIGKDYEVVPERQTIVPWNVRAFVMYYMCATSTLEPSLPLSSRLYHIGTSLPLPSNTSQQAFHPTLTGRTKLCH